MCAIAGYGLALTIVPTFACNIGGAVVESAKENYEKQSSFSSAPAPEIEESIAPTENVEIVMPTEEAMHYEINFEDPFLTRYSLVELQENKDEWVDFILLQLTTPTQHSYNENCKKYNEIIDTVHDYEKAYRLLEKEGLFKKDRSERVHLLETSIEIRSRANYYSETCKNQTLIGLRYADLASENYCMNGTESAIEAYEDAIYWQLESICTFYRTSSSETDDVQQIIDQIIKCYTQINNITNATDERHQRSAVLIEIYQMIEEKIAA